MNNPRMPSPAILVAVLALVAALAGTAIARPDASTSASVKKQIKNLKKRVEALENQGQVPGPQGAQGLQGQQGLPGSPGQDATKLFAYIRDNGSAHAAVVDYGSGVTAVSDPNPGNTYLVTFNQSLVNCVVHAVAGLGDPAGGPLASAAGFPFVNMGGGMPSGGPNQATVTFMGADGVNTDTSFLITAFC